MIILRSLLRPKGTTWGGVDVARLQLPCKAYVTGDGSMSSTLEVRGHAERKIRGHKGADRIDLVGQLRTLSAFRLGTVLSRKSCCRIINHYLANESSIARQGIDMGKER